MSIHTGRAQVRGEVRITICVTLAFAAGLLLLDIRCVTAYHGVGGQPVGGQFSVRFWVCRAKTRHTCGDLGFRCHHVIMT
jgi:hypothetical protein